MPPPIVTTLARLTAEIDTAMAIVAAEANGERGGCLVGFHTQASIDPPRYLVCLSQRNRTHRIALRAEALAVHFVTDDAGALAERFGGETEDDPSVDKFDGVDWRRGPHGAPVLTGLATWFAGLVVDRFPLGDHTGFLLEPLEGAARRGESPLRYARARRIAPGHPA